MNDVLFLTNIKVYMISKDFDENTLLTNPKKDVIDKFFKSTIGMALN